MSAEVDQHGVALEVGAAYDVAVEDCCVEVTFRATLGAIFDCGERDTLYSGPYTLAAVITTVPGIAATPDDEVTWPAPRAYWSLGDGGRIVTNGHLIARRVDPDWNGMWAVPGQPPAPVDDAG